MDNLFIYAGAAVAGMIIGRYLPRTKHSHYHLIIKKLNEMKEDLKEIKQQLIDADAKADKVATDVKSLHDKIDGIGDNPTPEEWKEVKDMATALNNKLQGIDDQTPE